MDNEKEHALLWEEYRYRHTHIWSTTYKVTSAVAAVSLVPYLKPDVVEKLGLFALSLPAIAVGLAVFGLSRLSRELRLFGKIKRKYREIQRRDFRIWHDSEERFARDVWLYLLLLIGLSIFNGAYVSWRLIRCCAGAAPTFPWWPLLLLLA